MMTMLLAAVALFAPQQPAAQAPAPPHVIAVYADLDSVAATRTMIVLRGFLEEHPGVVSVDVHVTPPDGLVRPVDRAFVAARGLNAGLAMAEMLVVNQSSRSADDFAAMARQLRLDPAQFAAAMTAASVDAAVQADLAAAAGLKLPKDVAVVIDGVPLRTAVTLTELESRLVAKL